MARPTIRSGLNVCPGDQGRIKGGNEGNCSEPPLEGGPRDEIYLFQTKYSFEKFRDSEAIQEYNSIFLCCVKYQGPPTAINFSTSLTFCQI